MHHEKKTPKARVVGVKPGSTSVHTGSGASELDPNRNGSSIGAGIQIPLGRSKKSKDENEEEETPPKAGDH